VTGAVTNANIACLGAWNQITYAVSNGNLKRNGVDSVAGVVNLQAQYGISATANSNQVTQWVDATNSFTPAALALTPALRNRIKAIRLAIITQNPKPEVAVVTNGCSSRTAASPTGLCAWPGVQIAGPITSIQAAPLVDLSNGDANWNRYRYRVYESIIPLRNIIWSKDTL
jgi:type IV pilus assembly protein PilW